jgi:restriction endonuclease S subunit
MKTAKLSETGDFSSGTTPNNSLLYTQGEIPYFKVSDMNAEGNEVFLKNTKLYLIDEKKIRIFPSNTIVFPKNGGAILTNKKRILKDKSAVDLNIGTFIPNSNFDMMYIYYFFLSLDFNKIYKVTALPTIDYNILKNVEIPLFSLAEQNRIVQVIESRLQAVEKTKKAVNEQLKLTKSLFDSYISKIYDKKKYSNVRLDEISLINPTTKGKIPKDDNMPITFVPMSLVDAVKGEILNVETRPLNQVRKGYTYFENNDILFAKITPCMQNGKHAIAKNLENGIGFGSTEFHVIKPFENVMPEWIHFYLRQKSYLLDAKNNMQGAVGQQRLPEGYLKETIIPLPPISEQKIIIEKLNSKDNKIRKIINSIIEQLSYIEALRSSILRQAFRGEL